MATRNSDRDIDTRYEGGWRRLYSAPKDGTPVEIGWPPDPHSEVAHWDKRRGGFVNLKVKKGFYTPTHWRPWDAGKASALYQKRGY